MKVIHYHSELNKVTDCLRLKTDNLLLTTKPEEVTCKSCWKSPTMKSYSKQVVDNYLIGLKERLDSNKELNEIKEKLTAMCRPRAIK